MSEHLNADTGRLCVTQDVDAKTATIHIIGERHEAAFDLTADELERLGNALLKTYVLFSGKKNYMAIFSAGGEE